MRFAEEFAAYEAEHGQPERIEVLMSDLNGIFRGKWLPGDSADKLETGGVRLPLSTYALAIMGSEVPGTGLGIVVGDPDGVLVPVPGTLRPVPWSDTHVVQVLAEMEDAPGQISALSPRGHLSRMLDRYSDAGLTPVVATELEFYLIQARDRTRDEPEPPFRTPDFQTYDMEVLEQQNAILSEILRVSEAQGLETDTLIAEYGPGQFEVNFHHTGDALIAADTALTFRRLVRGVAARHGLEATFMAKPYSEHPGNGMHVHASVLDAEGRNIFTPPEGETGPSDTLKRAVAGVLGSMRDLQAVFAPGHNSYRRFQPMSFAPATPDWGLDNRAAAVRLPQTEGPAARLEHRISGADVNPYLALTAVLGGMLYGLETDLPLAPPLDAPGAAPADPLAHDWATAVARFAGSDLAAQVFTKEYRDIYTAVRQDEIAALTSILTPVEYRYYLSRL